MADYPNIDRIHANLTRGDDETETNSNEGSSDIAGTYSFNDYQEDTGATAIYPNAGNQTVDSINYTILGLIGEAGEIANKWKKHFRDRGYENDYPTKELLNAIREELGDVLWYVSQLAIELDTDLGDIAADNIAKLRDRKDRGVIKGSGDDR